MKVTSRHKYSHPGATPETEFYIGWPQATLK